MKKSAASPRAIPVRDVMTPNPLSINETATIREAAAFLLEKRMGAAPVINEAGRALGVVSMSDIVRHSAAGELSPEMDRPVRTIMNDEVLFVRPETSIDKMIADLLHCNVKRLFVVDQNGVLVGVISATDVLRHVNSQMTLPTLRQTGQPFKRRPIPPLPHRPAPFASTPRTGSDIVMARAR